MDDTGELTAPEDVPVFVVLRPGSASVGAGVVSVHASREGAERMTTALNEDEARSPFGVEYRVVECLIRP